jgi:hypothetical protein
MPKCALPVMGQWSEHCHAKSMITFPAPKTAQNTTTSIGGNQTLSEQSLNTQLQNFLTFPGNGK